MAIFKKCLFVSIFVTFLISGCEQKAELDGPRKFFTKNKIGNSADYAVIKWGNSEDHVATVHGFMDDMKTCTIIADALNNDACAETGGQGCLNPFACQALN